MDAPLRVLLVEETDEEAARVVDALRGRYAPTVQRVATAEALRAALRQPWDCVIAACALPHLCGLAVLRLVQQSGAGIPVLLLCDTDNEEQAVAAMRAGAQDYLPKSHLIRLAPVVERELRQAQAARRHAQVEEALRCSEERYRNFIRSSTEGIYRLEFDPPIPTTWPVEAQIDAAFTNGYAAESNDRLAQMYGFTRGEEMIGKRLADLQIRRDDARFRAFIRAVIEADYHVSDAITHEVDRTGKPLVIANSVIGVVEHGLLRRVWATQRDITEQVRTQEALQASEARYRSLVEDISDWVWEVDESARFTYASPGVRQMLGYEPAHLLGKTPFEFMAPEEAQRVAEQFAGIAARRAPFSLLESTMIAQDGHAVVVEVNGVPLITPEGALAGYRGINRDITARKQAELALQRERAFLSTTVDVLPVALIFISPARALLFASRVAQGYMREHGMRQWDEVDWLTPEHLPVPRAQWPIQRALDHQETFTNVEGIIRFRDGAEVPALNQTAPVIVGGKMVAVVAAFQDITQLKAADEAKDRFLMYLSHELKTPLTSILGWAQAAESEADVVAQALPIIIRNARRQREMLDDLLDLSKIISGRFVLERERIDLWDAAAQSVEEIRPVSRERRITLRQEPPGAPLPVNADPKRLHQAICHLLENAVKFTEPDGTVTVTGRRDGPTVVLQVRDTGRGIAPEALPLLFAPFHQVNRPQTSAGLGLGLALVKGIVELHGGSVTAASPGAGQGSTFTLILPAAA